jgi:hypothetical protein
MGIVPKVYHHLYRKEDQVHLAVAAAEVEPILKEALKRPDGAEWQAAIDYEIGQLEKLGIQWLVNPVRVTLTVRATLLT